MSRFETTEPQLVLITGASRGIGAAAARRFARDGFRLALVARDGKRLDMLAEELVADGARAEPFVCDLSDETGIATLVEVVPARLGPVDILINNAGVGRLGPFLDLDPTDLLAAIRVPLAATMNTCHHFGRTMRQRGSGSIVNVVSPTCYFDLPYLSAYAPARTALLTFSKGLRKELSDQGVRVSTVSPPWVETDYFKNNDSDPGWLPRIAKIFPRVTAEQVAEVIHDAALRQNADLLPSLLIRIFAEGYRLTPGLLVGALEILRLYQPTPRRWD